MKLKLFIALTLASVAGFAQLPQPPKTVFLDPSGACKVGSALLYNTTLDKLWRCKQSSGANGTWTLEPAGISIATLQAGTPSYVRSTTGNDTYTGSVTPALTAYSRGMCVVLDADTANTLTATININGRGAVSILGFGGAALATGDISANIPKLICHNGTNFYIVGDGGSGGGGSSPLTVITGSGNPNGSQTCTAPTTAAVTFYYNTALSPYEIWPCVALNTFRLWVDASGGGPPDSFRLRGSTSGYVDILPPAIAGTSTFTPPIGASVSVLPLTPVASNFVTGMGTDGVLLHSRPNCATLSDAGAGCSGAGGSGADPTDFAAPSGSVWLSDYPKIPASGSSPYLATSGCASGSGFGAVGAGPTSIVPWQFYVTTGGTGAICVLLQPNSNLSNYGATLYDFASGATPVTHQTKARYKTGDRNADMYFGYSRSLSNFDNFIGCRALKTDTNWWAVVINATAVTQADTGIAVTVSTDDNAANTEKLNVNNGAGTANSITCSVNGTGNTAAATIPPGVWYRVLGVQQQGGTASVFAASWIGWQFTGVGTVH